MLKRKLALDSNPAAKEESEMRAAEQSYQNSDEEMSMCFDSESSSDDEEVEDRTDSTLVKQLNTKLSNSTASSSTRRVMVLSSRGINHRQRHLMLDMLSLLPHGKKESKLDSKNELSLINELMDLNRCDAALYFESRRHQDLYLWASMGINGPSIKFNVQNIHTLDELRLRGNCLKGSRAILAFGKEFDEAPHYKLVKECFSQIFNTPVGHRKSKPFVDHVISFSIVDNRIWFRHYQIVEQASVLGNKELEMSLVEIGPRFTLNIIRVFAGSFGGPTLYENADYISRAQMMRAMSHSKGSRYTQRVSSSSARSVRRENANLPANELDSIFG